MLRAHLSSLFNRVCGNKIEEELGKLNYSSKVPTGKERIIFTNRTKDIFSWRRNFLRHILASWKEEQRSETRSELGRSMSWAAFLPQLWTTGPPGAGRQAMPSLIVASDWGDPSCLNFILQVNSFNRGFNKPYEVKHFYVCFPPWDHLPSQDTKHFPYPQKSPRAASKSLSLPKGNHCSNFGHLRLIFLALELHVNGIIQPVYSFFVSGFFIQDVVLKFILVFVCICSFFLFYWWVVFQRP